MSQTLHHSVDRNSFTVLRPSEDADISCFRGLKFWAESSEADCTAAATLHLSDGVSYCGCTGQVHQLPEGAKVLASADNCPIAIYTIGEQVLCIQGARLSLPAPPCYCCHLVHLECLSPVWSRRLFASRELGLVVALHRAQVST